MGLLDQLTEKPWLASEDRAAESRSRGAASLTAAQVGLRVFLAVATVIFTLFLGAYLERMTFGDWRPLSDPWILWVNTALLVLSSVAMQRAWTGADRGQIDSVRNGLLAGGGFAFAFLAGQVVAWQQLVAEGYFATSNVANAFFYLVTAVHAVHLLGGLVAWARTTARVWQGMEAAAVRGSVELCAVYWHFLLLVWLILFALLLFT